MLFVILAVTMNLAAWVWKFTAKVFHPLFNIFHPNGIEFVDIMALLIKVAMDFGIPELMLVGIVAVLLFLAAITVFVFTVMTTDPTVGRRLPTAMIFCGPCLSVLAFVVIHIFMPPDRWVYLLPLVFTILGATAILPAAKEQDHINSVVMAIGKAVMYAMMWSVSPQIAMVLQVSDSTRLPVVFAVTVFLRLRTTRWRLSLLLLREVYQIWHWSLEMMTAKPVTEVQPEKLHARGLNQVETTLIATYGSLILTFIFTLVLWYLTPWRQDQYQQHQRRHPVDEETGRAGLTEDRRLAREAVLAFSGSSLPNADGEVAAEVMLQSLEPMHVLYDPNNEESLALLPELPAFPPLTVPGTVHLPGGQVQIPSRQPFPRSRLSQAAGQ